MAIVTLAPSGSDTNPPYRYHIKLDFQNLHPGRSLLHLHPTMNPGKFPDWPPLQNLHLEIGRFSSFGKNS